MAIIKILKDYIVKSLNGANFVPRGLLELHEYFKANEPIHFNYTNENGVIVAVSENFRYGSIVTSGKNYDELDKNIKDAILTSFEIPSSYSNEAKIIKVGEKKAEYVLA